MMQEKPRKKNGIRISSMTLCLSKGGLIYEYAKEYRPHCWHSSGRKEKILTMLL